MKKKPVKLSPGTWEVIHALADSAPPEAMPTLTAEDAVRYAVRACSLEEAHAVEVAAARDDACRTLFVGAYEAIDRMRKMPIADVQVISKSESPDSEFARAYLATMAPPRPMADHLAAFVNAGTVGRRIVQALLEASRSLGTPRGALALRSQATEIRIENLPEATVSLEVHHILRFKGVPDGTALFVAANLGRTRLRIASGIVSGGAIELPPEVGELAATEWVIRAGDWPEGTSPTLAIYSEFGPLVTLTEALVNDGLLTVRYTLEGRKGWTQAPGSLRILVTVDGSTWQLLTDREYRTKLSDADEVEVRFEASDGPLLWPLQFDWTQF